MAQAGGLTPEREGPQLTVRYLLGQERAEVWTPGRGDGWWPRPRTDPHVTSISPQ